MIQIDTYLSNYVEGAKLITFKSFYYCKSELKQSYENFILFFDIKGRLINSIHFENQTQNIIQYTYDSNNNLVKAVKFNLSQRLIHKIANYTYDSAGQLLTENYLSIWHRRKGKKYLNMLITHTYKANIHTMVMKSSQEDTYITYDISDSTGRVVESKTLAKHGSFSEWFQYEYDKSGINNRIISLDKKGELYCSFEYFPQIHGLCSGHKRVSMFDSFTQEFTYEFNEKGHWIVKTRIDDGRLSNLYRRKIYYY